MVLECLLVRANIYDVKYRPLRRYFCMVDRFKINLFLGVLPDYSFILNLRCKVTYCGLCYIWALPRIGSHSMHVKCGCFDKKIEIIMGESHFYTMSYKIILHTSVKHNKVKHFAVLRSFVLL